MHCAQLPTLTYPFTHVAKGKSHRRRQFGPLSHFKPDTGVSKGRHLVLNFSSIDPALVSTLRPPRVPPHAAAAPQQPRSAAFPTLRPLRTSPPPGAGRRPCQRAPSGHMSAASHGGRARPASSERPTQGSGSQSRSSRRPPERGAGRRGERRGACRRLTLLQ